MDPRERVALAIRCEEEGRLEDALAAWLELARMIPTYPQAYERIFAIHVHRREVDAAFCAASVLASLDALEGVARELYEDYVPRRLPPRPERGLDAEAWALLRHPLEDPSLGQRLAAAAPKLRLKPASEDAIDAETFAWAAAMLGASVGILKPDGSPPLGDRADLDELWRNYALRERLFFAGRAATAARCPDHLLWQATTRQLADAIGAGTTEEIERWETGVELTRTRAGLLVCGEVVVARELLQREKAGDAVLGELALFAVSREHHRLRAKLGIAIGESADAQADAKAAPAALVAPARPVAGAPPEPVPDVPGTLQARGLTAETIVRTLVEPARPPETVGALLDALGISLDAAILDPANLGAAAIDTTAMGTLVVPRGVWAWLSGGAPHVSVQYAFDASNERPISSVATLRERRVRAFSVVCFPRDAALAVLRARFGEGPEIAGFKGDDYRTFGPWVMTARSSQLGWFEKTPTWLRPPTDNGPRNTALRMLLDGLPKAQSRDDLRALVAQLPEGSGIVPRADREGIVLDLVRPIPVKVLDGFLVLHAIVERTAGGEWVMRRLARPGETGKTMPLTKGQWTLVPRLSAPPTAGATKESDEVHMAEALDVVTSIRIPAPQPQREAKGWRDVVEAVASKPPRTVAELCAAFGVGEDALDLRSLDRGIVLLPSVRVNLMPGTATAIGARRIRLWIATLSSALADAERVLAARFGVPFELLGDRRYGPFAVRPDTGHLLHRVVTGGPATLTCLAPHRDGRVVALGDAAGRLRLWSPAEARVVALHLLDTPIHAIDWPEDCFQLVVHAKGPGGPEALRVFTDDGTKHAPDSSVTRPFPATSCRVPRTGLAVACGVDALLRVRTERGEAIGALAFDDHDATVVEPAGAADAASWWASAVRTAAALPTAAVPTAAKGTQIMGASPMERALIALAQTCLAARDVPSLQRAAASFSPAAGIVHRADWSSAGSAVFQLAQPIDALALARLFGWAHPVGGSLVPRPEQWHVLLHTGATPLGPLTTLPMWGPWMVHATLAGRPNGPPLVSGGSPAGPFALAPGDVVYAIRVATRHTS